jgi:hypothetical protein
MSTIRGKFLQTMVDEIAYKLKSFIGPDPNFHKNLFKSALMLTKIGNFRAIDGLDSSPKKLKR